MQTKRPDQRDFLPAPEKTYCLMNTFEHIQHLQESAEHAMRQFEDTGFKKVWLPANTDALDQSVQAWESRGYEVRRLEPQSEALMRDLDSGGREPARVP